MEFVNSVMKICLLVEEKTDSKLAINIMAAGSTLLEFTEFYGPVS
jgi:hypothetical protein